MNLTELDSDQRQCTTIIKCRINNRGDRVGIVTDSNPKTVTKNVIGITVKESEVAIEVNFLSFAKEPLLLENS